MRRDSRYGFSLAALLALLLAAGGLAVLVFIFLPSEPPPAIAFGSSRECLECHKEVGPEWEKSHHVFAFENPEVRKLSNDFLNEECLACHAPRPVLDFAPGERVLARQSDRGLGVDCLACHYLSGGGGVATPNPSPDESAPCRPQTEPRLSSVDYCASCHNQHGTVDQWREASEELRGTGCLDCHMPRVRRSTGRQGRDHTSLAAHDPAMLKAAVKLEGEWTADGAWTALTNVGAAHNFPTDDRSRAADLQVRWRLDSWTDWERLWRMRDPYRDELDLTNTQLPSGETWRTDLTPPEGAQEAEVRLLYRTNPFQPDEEADEVYRVRLAP